MPNAQNSTGQIATAREVLRTGWDEGGGDQTPQSGELRLGQEHMLTAHLRGADRCLYVCLFLMQTYKTSIELLSRI